MVPARPDVIRGEPAVPGLYCLGTSVCFHPFQRAHFSAIHHRSQLNGSFHWSRAMISRFISPLAGRSLFTVDYKSLLATTRIFWNSLQLTHTCSSPIHLEHLWRVSWACQRHGELSFVGRRLSQLNQHLLVPTFQSHCQARDGEGSRTGMGRQSAHGSSQPHRDSTDSCYGMYQRLHSPSPSRDLETAEAVSKGV